MTETAEPEIRQSKDWFTISNTGWRRMNAGRTMGFLIREGISNVLDLEDATEAHITVEPGHVTIEDNGKSGFADPNLITTVFMTDKEDSATKRGRKGRGLKELISAADIAKVETVGLTVEFNADGRKEYKNDRTSGTKVEIWSSLETWQGEQVKESLDYLNRLIVPEKLTLFINKKKIPRPKETSTTSKHLQTTIIKNGVQVNTYATAKVVLYESKKNDSWIYEMGVPVQKIGTPWHIDIQQRIPMNDHRDTVDENYLKNLYGKLLDELITTLTEKDCQEDWAVNGLYWSSAETQKSMAVKIAGKKAVVKSTNKHANDVATQHGYELIDTTKMAWSMRDAMTSALSTAEAVAQRIEETAEIPNVIPTETMLKFVTVTKFLADKIVGGDVTIEFFKRGVDFTGAKRIATYKHDHQPDGTIKRTLRYNTQDGVDFEKPLSEYSLSILIHELSHEYGDGHDKEFQEALQVTGGKLANIILQYHMEIPFIDSQKIKSEKTILISCVNCGKKREIKAQDQHQVVRCVDCQQDYRRLRRKELRKGQ